MFNWSCISWFSLSIQVHAFVPHQIVQSSPSSKLIPTIFIPSGRFLSPAEFVGCSFATVPVAVAVSCAVQLEPHANPVGQHPPPAVSAQRNHPLAHRPVVAGGASVSAGTTMVRSLVVIVVDGVWGHELVSQSRPVRQHPPW